MKKKKTSRFNSFAVIMLIISFLVGFCGVGHVFGDKNEVPPTEQVSTLTEDPANVIPEKEPIIDSGNYVVKKWDDKIIEVFTNGNDFDINGSGTAEDPYKISTAEDLAWLSFLSNNNSYPHILERYPGYKEDQTDKVVPDGYIQFEYLQSSGSQYIDTDYITNPQTKIKMDVQLKTISGDQKIMGSYSGTGGICLGVYNNKWRLGVSVWLNNSISATEERTQISIDGNTWNINGEKATLSQSISTSNGSILLFGTRWNGSLNATASIKVYNFKIYENDILVKNFVPCYKIETEEFGLYDIENDVFHENKGTGAFNQYETIPVENKYFELTNDIYLNDGELGLNETTDEGGVTTYSVAYEDGSDGVLYKWTPITKKLNLNGNDYKIHGMYINENKDGLGLFSTYDGRGSITGLNLTNSLVYAPENSYVAGFTASSSYFTIKNCSFDGYVLGKSTVAGISACKWGIDLYHENCVNYGNIIAIENEACGICYNHSPYGTENCVNYGIIKAKSNAYGIGRSKALNDINKGKIFSEGYSYGVADAATNCINYGYIYGKSWAFGIASRVIENCMNYGEIYSQSRSAGIGQYNISNCKNYGKITSDGAAMGIGLSVINFCTNYADVFAKGVAAGISMGGHGGGSDIKNSINKGNIYSSENSASGIVGVIGYTGRDRYFINNCVNEGIVCGKSYTAGICADVYNDELYIINCQNKGDIKGGSYTGGILGATVDYTLSTTLVNCVNSGNVTSTASTVGGFIGVVNKGTTTIESCTNEGKVSGKTATGFVGKASSDCEIQNSLNTGDITSSTFDSQTIINIFGVQSKSAAKNCLNESKINGNLIKACSNLEDGYFNKNYRTGKIISKNANHNAIFQGVIDYEYITENNFINFTPKPVEVDFDSVYTKIEYIESTGTQYIDTGITMADNISIDVGFQYTSDNNTSGVNDNSLFGVGITGVVSNWFSFNIDGGNFQLHYNSLAMSFFKADTEYHNIIFNKPVDKAIEIDKQVYGNVTTSLTNSRNLYLFKSNQANLVSGAQAKIYHARLYDNGDLIRSFIPAKRNTDGVVGLYDQVEGKFYENQGTGNFVAGPKASQVPAGYQELKAITIVNDSVNGYTNGINTGVSWSEINKIKITNSTPSAANAGRLMILKSDGNGVPWIGYGGNNQYVTFNGLTGTQTQEYKVEDYVGGDKKEILYEVTSTSANKIIYGCWQDASWSGTSTLYSMEMYKDETLVRSFVPAKRNADGVVGLYDRVEGKFYTNQGSGDFVAGAVK